MDQTLLKASARNSPVNFPNYPDLYPHHRGRHDSMTVAIAKTSLPICLEFLSAFLNLTCHCDSYGDQTDEDAGTQNIHMQPDSIFTGVGG